MRYFKGVIVPELLSLRFKWQWSIVIEKGGIDGEDLRITANTRREARSLYTYYRSQLSPKIRMERRLVQVNWEHYNDSFGWNAGCGKR